MTQVDRTTFKSNTQTLYSDNTTGNIGANDLRAQMNDIADSAAFRSTGYANAPTAGDDEVDTAENGAFGVGDIWVDETNNKAYICLDSSSNAAVWIEMTYTDASTISPASAPEVQELGVWVDGNTIRGFAELTYNGTNTLTVGKTSPSTVVNIALQPGATVDGRDISVDGAKLDGIPTDAISSLTLSNVNVSGSSTGFTTTSLAVVTGDGLELINLGSGNTRLEVRNNDITKDTGARTIAATDNGSFVTNEGAAVAITWTLPVTSALQSTPRLVATFFKVANQTMRIVGANGVSVNGATETGSNESLIEICPVPYDSFAIVMYAGVTNTYYVIQGTDIKKLNTTANTEIAYWAGDGQIEGASGLTWDGSTLEASGVIDATGEVKGNWAFNPQTGTAYSVVLTDRGRIITMNNASANTLTIPINATVALPIGTEIRVIQIGAGTTSIQGSAAAGGVTINGIVSGSGDITARWREVRLYKVGADTWYAVGEIGAVT